MPHITNATRWADAPAENTSEPYCAYETAAVIGISPHDHSVNPLCGSLYLSGGYADPTPRRQPHNQAFC